MRRPPGHRSSRGLGGRGARTGAAPRLAVALSAPSGWRRRGVRGCVLPPRTGAPAGGQGAQLLAADVSPCDATAGTTGDNDRRRPEPGSLEFAVAARYVKPGVGRPHTRVWRWGRTVRGDVRERVDAQRGVFRAGGRRGGGLCRMRRHFYPTHFLFFLLFKKKSCHFSRLGARDLSKQTKTALFDGKMRSVVKSAVRTKSPGGRRAPGSPCSPTRRLLLRSVPSDSEKRPPPNDRALSSVPWLQHRG